MKNWKTPWNKLDVNKCMHGFINVFSALYAFLKSLGLSYLKMCCSLQLIL